MFRKFIFILMFMRYYEVVIILIYFIIYLNEKWCFSNIFVRVYWYLIIGMYLFYLGLGMWFFF